MKKLLLLLSVTMIFSNCSNEEKELELQNEINSLKSQVYELNDELDECENGSEKILAKIKIANNDEEVKSLFLEIKKRHPESEEYIEAKIIYDKIIQEEENEKARLLKEEERLRKEKLKSLKKLKKKYDDVSGITWYNQPYFTHYTNTNRTSIYMGVKEERKWLILMMSYEGDDWIFFENAYLSYDGNTKEISFNEYKDKETDVSNGVSEWISVSVNKDIEDFLREFAKSDNAKMRLSGKRTKTRKLSSNERKGILDVLNGYDALNE